MTQMILDRRRLLSGFAASAALTSMPAIAAGAAPAFTTGLDPRLTVEGRTAPGPDGRLRIGFPGVAVRFVARADTLTMRIAASSVDAWIDITLDDSPPRVVHLAKGVQDVVLFDQPGEHRVQVLKRTESWQGQIEILGFAGATRVAPIPLPDRRITMIGDSITCGAATDVPDVSSTINDASANDGAKSFGRVLAKRLGAACHLVSYGGRGIIRDWQGIRDIANAPIFYERAMPDEPQTLWDHRRYVPDAIGICLGTNDFNQGVPDQNEFVNAYVEFVRKLLRDAPRAAVFLIDSPMTVDSPELGHRHTIQQDYIAEVVRRIGLPHVASAAIRHYPGRPINSHPIASEHVAIAAELEPVFRSALNWS